MKADSLTRAHEAPGPDCSSGFVVLFKLELANEANDPIYAAFAKTKCGLARSPAVRPRLGKSYPKNGLWAVARRAQIGIGP